MKISGAIFSLVALFHALRLLKSWEAMIGGWTVPMWLSIVGVLLAGTMAYLNFKHSK